MMLVWNEHCSNGLYKSYDGCFVTKQTRKKSSSANQTIWLKYEGRSTNKLQNGAITLIL